MHGLPGLLALLGAGLVLAWAGVVIATMHLLTTPLRRTYAWAVSRGRPGDPSELPRPRAFTAWTHTTARGATLPAWTIEGDAPGGPIVIFTHGWGESKLAVLPRVEALAACSSRIIAWDLPGHGEASPGRARLGSDEAAALNELIATQGGDRSGAADQALILYGYSLGAGVCLMSAGASRVSGVIVEAPYRMPWTPAGAVLAQRGLPHCLTLPPAMWWLGIRLGRGAGWRGFDRAEIARAIRCPLLVVQGDADEISPVDDARAIAAAGRGELRVIAGAGHHDIWTEHAAEAGEGVRAFVERIAPGVRLPHDAVPPVSPDR